MDEFDKLVAELTETPKPTQDIQTNANPAPAQTKDAEPTLDDILKDLTNTEPTQTQDIQTNANHVQSQTEDSELDLSGLTQEPTAPAQAENKDTQDIQTNANLVQAQNVQTKDAEPTLDDILKDLTQVQTENKDTSDIGTNANRAQAHEVQNTTAQEPEYDINDLTTPLPHEIESEIASNDEDPYAWARDLPGFENIYEQLVRNAIPIHDPEEQAKKIAELREYIGEDIDIFFDETGVVNLKQKTPDRVKFPMPDYSKSNVEHLDIFDKENPLKERKGCLTNFDPGEVEDAENKFIDFVLFYENEIKQIKAIYKMKSLEYQSKGVNTKAVVAAIKKIAKDSKKDPMVLSNEETTLERLSSNRDLVERIKSALL